MKNLLFTYILFITVSSTAQINLNTNSYVGSYDSTNVKIAALTKEMFASGDYNKYRTQKDIDRWGDDFESRYWINSYIKKDTSRFKFQLQGVEKMSENQYDVTFSFTMIDSINIYVNSVISLNCTYFPKEDKFLFSQKINDFVDSAYHIKIDGIDFYKVKGAPFNMEQAKSMSQSNREFAKIFKVKPIDSIHYLSFKNTDELFDAEGFEYIENIHLSNSGALAQPGKEFKHIILSGNDKETYPHELVHFYLGPLLIDTTIKTTRFAVEGICTYLGGTNDMTLDEQFTLLKKMIDEGYKFDFMKNITTENIKYSYDLSSNQYIISGYLARRAYEKKGLDGFKELLSIEEDNLLPGVLKMLDTTEDKLSKEFYAYLDNLK